MTNLSDDGYGGAPDQCVPTTDEQPVNTVGDALSPPATDGANEGFLREDAILFVVAITDEDEQPRPGYESAEEIVGKLVAAKEGKIENVVFLGIGGAQECVGGNAGVYGDARYAQRLQEIAALFGQVDRGVFWDLCEGNLEQAFAEAIDEVVDTACREFDPVG